MANPWVLPIQKPHPPVWFPGTGSPESVIWAAQHQYPYMNLGSLLDLTKQLKQIYFETAHEVGFEPGPQHFGYLMRCLVADTDEKAQEIGAPSCGPRTTVTVAQLSLTTLQGTSPGRLCASKCPAPSSGPELWDAT